MDSGEPQAAPCALDGLHVLEIASPLTAYCGKMFADLGAAVVLIEPHRGCRLRCGDSEEAGGEQREGDDRAGQERAAAPFRRLANPFVPLEQHSRRLPSVDDARRRSLRHDA